MLKVTGYAAHGSLNHHLKPWEFERNEPRETNFKSRCFIAAFAILISIRSRMSGRTLFIRACRDTKLSDG